MASSPPLNIPRKDPTPPLEFCPSPVPPSRTVFTSVSSPSPPRKSPTPPLLGKFPYKGPFLNYVDKPEVGEGMPNVNDTMYISLWSKFVDEGGKGVKNSKKPVNVVFD